MKKNNTNNDYTLKRKHVKGPYYVFVIDLYDLEILDRYLAIVNLVHVLQLNVVKIIYLHRQLYSYLVLMNQFYVVSHQMYPVFANHIDQ